MGVKVEDVNCMSVVEVSFYYYRFTEECLIAEGWTKRARSRLHERIDEIEEQKLKERRRDGKKKSRG